MREARFVEQNRCYRLTSPLGHRIGPPGGRSLPTPPPRLSRARQVVLTFFEIFNIAFLSRCCDLLAVIDQFLQFCRNSVGNLQEFFSIFPRVTARAVMCKVNEGRSAAKGDGNEHGD